MENQKKKKVIWFYKFNEKKENKNWNNTLIRGSVESSKTWIIIRSDGHVSPQAAPIDNLYTYKPVTLIYYY